MNTELNNNRIGFCCTLLGNNPSKFRSTTVTWCSKNLNTYEQKLREITKSNLSELTRVINYCINRKIWLYRISSDLIPLPDHPLGIKTWLNSPVALSQEWQLAKEKVTQYLLLGGRLTVHPSQYVSISSPKDNVRQNSINNLEYHGLLFDRLGLPRTHFALINIHVSNGKLGNLSVNTVRDSIARLSDSVVSRLTFENEDKSFWTAENLSTYFHRPIVFDTLHYSCNSGDISFDSAFEYARQSWESFAPKVRQLCHHSEGITGPNDRRHSDFVEQIPALGCDIEVEAKMKNLAIEKFL